MNIICIAAMVIALIIGLTIVICVYLKHSYNPAVYDDINIINSVHVISRTILERYDNYYNAEEKDKYAFLVSEKQVIDAFKEIKEITEV